MLKIVKKMKLLFNKSGSGSTMCRVTIPQDIVKQLELKEGDYLEFTMSSFGCVNKVFISKAEGEK